MRSVAAPIVTIGAAASVVAQMKSEGAHQNRTQKYLPSQLTGSLHSKQIIVQYIQNRLSFGALFRTQSHLVQCLPYAMPPADVGCTFHLILNWQSSCP